MHEPKQGLFPISPGHNKEAERLTARLCRPKRDGGNGEAWKQNQTIIS